MRRILDALGRWLTRGVPLTLTCAELEEFIVDYHDGSLPLRRRIQFRVHLMLCPRCRTYFDGYRQTVALGKTVFVDPTKPAREEAPEELIQAILASRPR